MGQDKEKTKPQKFSYSKINNYKSCGWKYYLMYDQGHFTFTDSLASLLGTLLHSVEEKMFNTLKKHEKIDYEAMKDYFMNAYVEKKNKYDKDGGIYGLNYLKENYKEEFYKMDDKGHSYFSKTLDYMNKGIYRLEKYLKDNPDLEPFEAEKFFSFTYKDQIVSGYIDRIFYNKVKDTYIIEDIKTKDKPFSEEDLETPLQFVTYVLGLNQTLDIPMENIKCVYDLPFLDLKQEAGAPGYMKRGINELSKTFSKIEQRDFTPKPSPLCYFCAYCKNNPESPEDARDLCPYYSLWTRENKTREVANKWLGMEHHEEVMEKERKKNEYKVTDMFDFDF